MNKGYYFVWKIYSLITRFLRFIKQHRFVFQVNVVTLKVTQIFPPNPCSNAQSNHELVLEVCNDFNECIVFFPCESLLTCCISCLLYTSDAADDLLCVDLGGRRIIKKKKKINYYKMTTAQ